MSAHLRHCAKHSRPGRPMLLSRCGCSAPVRVPTVAAAIVEPAPRRGRPPKYGRAMSAAEQKRRKREEKERRDLAAWLMHKFRSMQMCATTMKSGERKGNFNESTMKNLRDQRMKFAETLDILPVKDLKQLKSVWSETPDSQGRLHGERSGEADQRHGQSEIESIAEQQRSAQDGRRVKPQGYNPKRDEKTWDSPDDVADTATESPKAILNEFRSSAEEAEKASRFYDKMHLVARWMMKEGKCSVCGSTDGEDHIWHKYYECVAAEARFRALFCVDPNSAFVLYELIDHDHIWEIDKLLRKRWVFFASVDDRVGTKHSGDLLRPRDKHGELIIHYVEGLVRGGWAFFSTIRDRTEYVLPGQGAVRIFFGHFKSWSKYVDYV